MKRALLRISLLCVGSATIFTACSSNKGKGVSDKTGWNYNDSRLGGFTVATDYNGMATGPGLAFVEGGRFTMGQTDEDIYYRRDNIPRTITVSSFYMDETEVANVHYREYIYWLNRAYSADYPEVVSKAMPDTTVWRSALSYNEPLVNYYFRHAAYDQYPVVGVNWYQANDYAKWRSDRVNEMILIKNGILNKNTNQINEDVFDTDAYAADQYGGTDGKRKPKDLDPNGAGKRGSKYEDGLLLPNYRLPTEAEWEYAAVGNISENPAPETKRRRGEEALTNRKSYPWEDIRSTRYQQSGAQKGEMVANFKRRAGDQMGVPGGLNDNADIPAPVYSYQANAYGLYNMAGNVSEWVLDVYRPTSLQDFSDHRPYVGNEYADKKMESDYTYTEKDSLGRMVKTPVTAEQLNGQYNRDFKKGDTRDVLENNGQYVYDYGKTTTINNDTRVIKGGSWNDRAYWLNPGTRRHYQANHASSTIGFRLVMDRLGSPKGNGKPTGNYFNSKKK